MTRPTIADLPPKCVERNRRVLGLAAPEPRKAPILAPAKAIRRPDRDATAYFVAAGLPAPVREHRFCRERRWRFDYAWPSAMVALEVEGGVWTRGRHTRGSGFVKDMEKYNRAAVLGWRVLRVQPGELTTHSTVGMILEAMG